MLYLFIVIVYVSLGVYVFNLINILTIDYNIEYSSKLRKRSNFFDPEALKIIKRIYLFIWIIRIYVLLTLIYFFMDPHL
jgi:hypothetical protein